LQPNQDGFFMIRLCLSIIAAAAVAPAHASCGATSCTLLTDRFALANWDHVGWTIDSRIEFVTQDRLQSGTHRVGSEAVEEGEPIERRTRNTSLVTTIERSFDRNWSMALRVPVVDRDHVHDDPEAAVAQSWRFTRMGDVQLLARFQQADTASGMGWAVFGGLKLPTGSRNVTNADGERAERALQPGTGTTDGVAGVALRQVLNAGDAISGGLSLQRALQAREDFRPGMRIEASAQWAHAFSAAVSGIVQINASYRGRDAGAQSEPDASGATTLALSPGASVAIGERSAISAFVQLPLYQRVNGVQLVPRFGFSLGVNHAF
jgi:hypothetical protein